MFNKEIYRFTLWGAPGKKAANFEEEDRIKDSVTNNDVTN